MAVFIVSLQGDKKKTCTTRFRLRLTDMAKLLEYFTFADGGSS